MINPATDSHILNGSILINRKIIESAVWYKPHIYLKVWLYLLSKAQYKPYKGLDRGQTFITCEELREACKYYVGYRKVTPSSKEIYNILSFLRNPAQQGQRSGENTPMIETTKGRHGVLVTIVNYDSYLNIETNEENNEGGNNDD